MNAPLPRLWPIFFELYALPMQGPGNRDCAARALALCRDLPPAPAVLDPGCGLGRQTLHLADLTSGSIVALDSHAPSIGHLRATVAMRGGMFFTGRWGFVSRNCPENTRTTTKRSPCLISLGGSPRCTGSTQATRPMSSLWRV